MSTESCGAVHSLAVGLHTGCVVNSCHTAVGDNFNLAFAGLHNNFSSIGSNGVDTCATFNNLNSEVLGLIEIGSRENVGNVNRDGAGCSSIAVFGVGESDGLDRKSVV